MKYKLWNKNRFLRNDEVVIDQEGNILVLDDGDAPNHIRNCLDVDILLYTNKKDKFNNSIIEGDILIIKKELFVVAKNENSFELVSFNQQQDGDFFIQRYLFDGAFVSWQDAERVGNVIENDAFLKIYNLAI